MNKKSAKNKKNIKSRISINKNVITINELAYMIGMKKRLLERLVNLDVIEPVFHGSEFIFSVDLLPRLKKILRLHDELGVAWGSMAMVLGLLDRIDKMQEELNKCIKQ